MSSALSINKLRAQSECETPDSCIHCVVLDIEHPTATGKKAVTKKYMQKEPLPKVFVYDELGSGIDVKVDLASKGCVTKNPNCPAGKLFSAEANKSYEVSAGVNKYHLTSYDFFEESSSPLAFLFFLDSCLLGSTHIIPSTTYTLSISECRGNSLLEAFYDFFNQPKAIVATRNEIVIFPKFEWGADLTLDFTEKIKKSSACSVSLSAGNSLTVGNQSREYKTRLAQRDIKLNGRKSNFLKKIKSIKRLKNQLAKLGATSEYDVLELSFSPPTIRIDGKGSLQFSKQNVPYINRDLTLNLKNLLNFEIKVDILQAVAARYKMDDVVADIRKKQAAKKAEIEKNGKNGAYVGTEFDIFFKVEVSVICTLTSRADELWGISLANAPAKKGKKAPCSSIEGAISIGSRIAFRVGAKLSVVDGFYEGEIHLEGKAEIVTQGCFSISPHKAGGLELILFHNGIWAEVGFTVNTSLKGGTNSAHSNRGAREHRITEQQNLKNFSVKKNERWQIYQPCPKESSQCRVHFLPNPTPRAFDVERWNMAENMLAL